MINFLFYRYNETTCFRRAVRRGVGIHRTLTSGGDGNDGHLAVVGDCAAPLIPDHHPDQVGRLRIQVPQLQRDVAWKRHAQ